MKKLHPPRSPQSRDIAYFSRLVTTASATWPKRQANQQTVPSSRACIIGAGSSGLVTARYMKEYGLNITVFEATRHVGGLWRYNPRIGTDEDGFREFPSMYKNMRSNTVIEVMAFKDFPFPRALPTFVSATCIYKYLQTYANHFNLMKHIQFRSKITKVQWTGDKWYITYLKSGTRTYVTEECGFVVVTTGEDSAPNMPYFEKQEEFRGIIMHSQDFKDPEHFRDQSVLVVGAGPSGYDMYRRPADKSNF